MPNQKDTIKFVDFQKIDVRVGIILSVELAEGCRVPVSVKQSWTVLGSKLVL